MILFGHYGKQHNKDEMVVQLLENLSENPRE